MKRWLCAFLAILMLCSVMLTGCGSDSAKEDGAVDIDALTRRMQEASDLPVMLTIRSGDERAERGFAAISTLAYDKVESFTLLYAADGSAYELAVIRLKDISDSKALEDTLRAHIDSRVQTYRNYDAAQVPRAEGAVVALHGRYAALIMCDDNPSVRAVFDQAFG